MDVYRFEVFDRVARRFTLDPRYAIAPTIDRLNGIALLETRRDVDTALVDRHGFYTGPDLDGTR